MQGNIMLVREILAIKGTVLYTISPQHTLTSSASRPAQARCS